MDKLNIKYSAYSKALPPRPIRIKTPGWSGTSEKMQDGSDGQPWHCLPFVEASTYGLELVYQYENECHVVNDNGNLRFEWDWVNEPGAELTGGEFVPFAPRLAPKYYLFNTRLDVQPPPGHVVRSAPHPRFFTDDTGTVPLAMIGHMQTEWYPRLYFVVFRAPRPGRRHIFRKGEAYAQIIFVPARAAYEPTKMTAEEEAKRRELELAIQGSRFEIADHKWHNSDGGELDNHYKILARAFASDGHAGVAEAVQEAAERRDMALPKDKSIAECLAMAAQLLQERRYRQAMAVYSHILSRDPNNAEALSQYGIRVVGTGNVAVGLEMMGQAVALEPRTPRYQSNLGEMLRLLGRFQDAEAAFRSSLQLNPNDPGIWSVLGLTIAQQGRPAEGLQACQKALSLGKPLPAAHYRIGLIHAQQGHNDQARASYEAALTIDPAFADARRALQALPPNTQPG